MHHFVEKGWGSETWIVNKQEYCGKLLKFKRGKQCSVHYHVLKDETFYLHTGRVMMRYIDIPTDRQYTDQELLQLFDNQRLGVKLESGDSFYVPRGRIHQVEALDDSEVFEFSTEHFDSDSYRLRKGD